ncbi:hypothetical protein OIV19_21500 [Brucella sp. HL-2]|nr:hypothetical protein [Brucella sp. HL-2]MCV9910174.1 hypothetical protein [Brucella sp. HL-2]
MSRERASLNLDLEAFKPRAPTNVVPTEELERMAEEAGFSTRHAPQPILPKTEIAVTKPKKLKMIDGRRRRKSTKTAQLNIAVAPEDKNRFWELADKLDLIAGGDVMAYLLDLAEGAGQGE